jgi:hypothetical protein
MADKKKFWDKHDTKVTVGVFVVSLLAFIILTSIFVGIPVLFRQMRRAQYEERDARLVRIETTITGVSINSGAAERDRFDSNPKFRIMSEGIYEGRVLLFESDIFFYNPIMPSSIGTKLYVLLDPDDPSYYRVDDSRYRAGYIVFE